MVLLVLTVFEDNDRIFDALCAGGSGYLLKRTPVVCKYFVPNEIFGLPLCVTTRQARFRLRHHGLKEALADRKSFRMRIPRDGDQRSELMSITIPK